MKAVQVKGDYEKQNCSSVTCCRSASGYDCVESVAGGREKHPTKDAIYTSPIHTWWTAVEAAGLVDTLRETVHGFAHTNEAFAKLPVGIIGTCCNQKIRMP